MRSIRTTKASAFTLVEILIVVIILGILAAIVIPQFTNASQDARKSSLTSQLQTIRSQVELYKMQHRDTYPTDDGAVDGAWDWSLMTSKTDETGATGTGATFKFGPYLQAPPVNPISSTGATTMHSAAAALSFGSAGNAGDGWAIDPQGKIFALSKLGTYVYDEADTNAANNEK